MLNPLHPVLKLLTAEPQLVLDHVGGYADWLSSELGQASLQWRLRLILGAVALASVCAAVVLSGVAVMLAVMLPYPDAAARWVLVFTPLFPLLLAVACVFTLQRKPCGGIVDQLKSQIKEDILMFQEASTR